MQTASPTRKVKVLEFITLFAVGGTERQVMNLAKGLDQSRFELHFACLNRYGELVKEIDARDVPITEYPVRSLRSYHAFRQQVRFSRYLKECGIDIVHSYNFYGNVFAIPAARMAGVPVVLGSIRDLGDPHSAAQRFAEKLACRLADSIVVNAKAVKNRLAARGYRAETMTVIRNGVDLSTFEGDNDRQRERVRRELGIPAGAPLIVVVARLNRLKGIEYFLEAARIVADHHPRARFAIVGDGLVGKDGAVVPDFAYTHHLQEYAVRLGLNGRVIFAGERHDIADVFSATSVSVLPSLSEGLSNTLLESMAAGVPVVATTVGGNPEIVESGITGLLVPPRNSAALARAVSFLLDNPELARRFGEAGKRRVREDFSLERMVRETEELYVQLLRKVRQEIPTWTWGVQRRIPWKLFPYRKV